MIGRMMAAAVALAPGVLAAEAEAQAFDGLYVGVSVSLHNVIGGALVSGVDVLVQETRPAVTFFGGYRKEFGFEDGDLEFREPTNSLAIDYANNTHWRYGGYIGFKASEETMLFAYLNETKRDFEVSGRGILGNFTQNDGQGLLGYGVGVEYGGLGAVNLRGTIGSSRADFGGRRTNIEPDKPIEVSLGALYPF